MKLVKYLMPLLGVAGLIAASVDAQIIGQETVFDRRLNNRDDQPVREFVESKENIDVKTKSNNLEISGDVRFEWQSIQEKGDVFYFESFCDPDDESSIHKTYRGFRGGSHILPSGIPLSTNDFDVEFNLKLKYTFKKAWCYAQLTFDNPAGIGASQTCAGTYTVFNREGSDVIKLFNKDTRRDLKGSGSGFAINLKRAFMGYNIWADGKHRLDIEVGRRKLDDVFESEIEFSNRFDGGLLKFASAIDEVTDWYWNTGVFVIDENVNHFGWVTEIGLVNILDSGLEIRYSFIDWKKNGRNRCHKVDPIGTQFQNSQWSFDYRIRPTIYGDYELPLDFYGAFLVNHAARREIFTKGKKENLGWYGGVFIGQVDKEGDWSLDIEYIAIQAQAVPDSDVGSIARGNILNNNLFDIVDPTSYYPELSTCPSDSSSGKILGLFPRQGNANFYGWRFEFLYAITDNLSLDITYQFSNALNRDIGGRHYYSNFEIESIYAF